MTNVKLSIEGMHCQACVRRVNLALEKLEGVRVERVHVGAAEVGLAGAITPAAVAQAITDAGYPATVDA